MQRPIAIAATLLALLTLLPSSLIAADRPNIVLIVADDLGYADIGAQGRAKDVRTPNVDTIAKNGVRFTSGYVSCPVCSPTRAGLMTGRYQQRFGHEFNPGPNESPNVGLPMDQVTMAQSLHSAGYVTGMVGKWHLGYKPEMRPPQRGFDEFFGFLGGAHSYLQAGEGRNAILRGDKPVGEVEYLTDAFGKEAAAFIERHHTGEKPFFLYLPFNAVHMPAQVTEKYEKRFAGVSDQRRRILLAKLSALDDAVGRVLEKIRDHKLEKDTLIFFISDNGGPTGSNGSRNDPLSGFKGEVKEGGIREPFLMQWTGHLPAGKIYDQPVISLDLFPTALAAAAAPTPQGVHFDGVNLLPVLAGESDQSPHKSLCWRYGPQWAIRDGNYKLRQAEDDGRSPKLFDLAADIAEKNDLAAERSEIVKRLMSEYDQWNAKNEPPRWHSTRRNGNGQKRPRGGGGGGGGGGGVVGATTAESDDE